MDERRNLAAGVLLVVAPSGDGRAAFFNDDADSYTCSSTLNRHVADNAVCLKTALPT